MAAPLRGRFALKLRARPGMKARTAQLEVRAARVPLRGPRRPGGRLEPRAVTVVEVREVDVPKGVKEPLHGVLLTDLPVETFEDARRVVALYTQRRHIEEYHKVLKTGLGLEKTQLTTAQGVYALCGLFGVPAVRILALKHRARTTPDRPVRAEEVGAAALRVLEAHYTRPAGGWTDATLLGAIAQLGGGLARKGDGMPGWQTLWRGYQQLEDMVRGYRIATGT